MPPRFWLLACLALSPFGSSAGGADLALDYRQVILKNGMRVISLEDFSCPIVAVEVWFHVGSRDELPRARALPICLST